MNDIVIEDIKWVSKEALEACVILTDGDFNLRCFCQPLENELGKTW